MSDEPHDEHTESELPSGSESTSGGIEHACHICKTSEGGSEADAVFAKLQEELLLYHEKKTEEERIERACKAYGKKRKK